ncbi:VOC family protein [Xanthovirga aplysinae]|uniref:VOC family protein n=1 Tax=Xanthovirga aplysinae TaxID=2529853 RepID=UPI0012BD3C65|nr:VOC family protein [Xanthovirga aplysinae]MTI31974.1 VOC family protein [Xanthovirga aplysinae]
MTTANVYLTFNGNCEEAFNFYQSVFGGEFSYVGKFKDMPPMEGQPPISPEHAEKIMHMALPLSEETVIMGSDTMEEGDSNHVQGNNFSISIDTDSKNKADKLFDKLTSGGVTKMPMNKTFWGDYFGMLTDKFGINWMISFNENPQK